MKAKIYLLKVSCWHLCLLFRDVRLFWMKNWSSQSAEEYYATAEGYESLINGAYSTLKSVYNTTNYFLLTQLGTDLGTQNDGTATNALNQYTVDYTNDNGTVYNQWKVLYESLKM